MRLHEQIYTSAARLLEGGGHLGVVAQTRDFPRAVLPQLAPLRAYTILDRYDLAAPASHPSRLVLGPVGDGQSYAVTRTVFAGADHTGRTTPLAHHVVIDVATAKRAAGGAAGVVNAVWPLLKSSWPGEPQWIDPPHDVAPNTPPPAPPAWQPLLPWLAGTLIDFARTGRAAVLVVDPDDAAGVPAGLLAVLSLLPSSLQWSATLATHAVAVGDFVREAGLLVTYPGTALLEQCRQRRDSRAPRVFDLTRDPFSPKASAGDWGDLLRRAAIDHGIHRPAERFDAFGLAAEHVAAFAAASNLVHDLAVAPAGATSDDWKKLAGRMSGVTAPPAVAQWIAEAATQAVRALAADEYSATRWHTLAAVVADAAWPDAARTTAAEALMTNGPDALDAAAEVNGLAGAAGVVFRAALRRDSALPQATITAAASGDPAACRRAAFVLSHAALSRDAGRPVVDALYAAPAAVGQQLLPAVVRALATGFHDADDIVSLGDAHADACRFIVLPVLRQRMRQTQDGYWQTLERHYRECAIADGLRQEDYADLFKEFGPSMRRGIDAWLNHPKLTDVQQREVRAVAERTGIIAPARAPVPIVSGHDDHSPPFPSSPGVETARPQPVVAFGSAGPIRIGLYLSLIVVILCGVSAVVVSRSHPPRDALHRPEILIAASCVGLWAVSELFFRLVVRSPQQLGVARWGRRLVALLLLLAVPLAAWPTLTRWRPSLGHDVLSLIGLDGQSNRGSP